MKRIILSAALVLLAVSVRPAVAAEEGVSNRYAGSFIAESVSGQYFYWYVHPDTGERYAISDSIDFSRLLRKVGQGSTFKDLSLISESGVDAAGEAATADLRGRILIATDDNGKAWYVDPLSGNRYYFANGQAGFDVAKELALDIRTDRLTAIPVTDVLGFSTMTYTSQRTFPDVDYGMYDLVYEIITTDHLYADEFNGRDIFYGSLKGLVEATGDENSEFLKPSENQEQQSNFSGDISIEGIGAVIQARNDSVYIVSVLKGSPAERAGLQPLDQILQVDGEITAGFTVDDAVRRIKGPKGSVVHLLVYRASAGLTLEPAIVREQIDVPAVESATYDNGTVAYFRFTLFTADLVEEFLAHTQDTLNGSTKGIILDLRDNVGGVTNAAARLVDLWLQNGEVVYQTKRGTNVVQYTANPDRLMPSVPVYILINQGTASASEIFSGAMQQHKQATLIGTPSFGKGTGQNIVNFDDGSGLKFTTFAWLLPDGSSVDKKGLTPDILVQPNDTRDVQLERARELILGGR